MISGGSDSNLVLWRDVTEKRQEEAEEARQKLVLQEQELANLLKSDRLLSALILALSLDRPLQVLQIIRGERRCCTADFNLSQKCCWKHEVVDISSLKVLGILL